MIARVARLARERLFGLTDEEVADRLRRLIDAVDVDGTRTGHRLRYAGSPSRHLTVTPAAHAAHVAASILATRPHEEWAELLPGGFDGRGLA